jgi:succinylarginine dihydrolase
MNTLEVNFDGLVGPTHNYAGLAHGNVASMSHGGLGSNPREAALQGLAKMKTLADLGVAQAVLPPHPRPSIETLRAHGFTGTDARVLRTAAQTAPQLLAACTSASSMWVANAATVTPSCDAPDGRVHFTPANLIAKFHRSIEPPQTAHILAAIFHDPRHFVVHPPVLGGAMIGDEGAANHTRFAPNHGSRGLHCYVYGHRSLGATTGLTRPKRYVARQALEASEAVVRQHGLPTAQVCFVQQSPAAIDAGVFHNDVISVGNENLLLYHESAFVRTPAVIADLRQRYATLYPAQPFFTLKVPARRVSLRDAVTSYLFNSQIVTVAPGRMALIAPTDCAENPRVHAWLNELIGRGHSPLREVHYFDLKQSMRNGGGPACLRLRVVLTPTERSALPPGIFITDATHARLVAWVKKHYREKLLQSDLADPELLKETHRALDELTHILGIGSIYPFQLAGASAGLPV